MGVKVAIIGAGSAVFSINLIKDICINRNFDGSEVALMDINERRLNGIYSLCRKYIQATGVNIGLSMTMDRREALQGADFVMDVALDYGHERLKDGWKVAEDCGYRYGGSLHVMHDEAFWVNWYQIKLMEDIYKDILDICPDAWYLLVANPVQAGTTYLCRKYPGAKVIGMCHGGYRALNLFDAMGLDRKDCTWEVSGVNHFVFMNSFYYKGQDAFPLLDKWLADGENMKQIMADPLPWRQSSPKLGPKAVDLYHRYGVFPIGDTNSPGGGAWGWWYHTDDVEQSYMEDAANWWKWHFQRGQNKLDKIWASIEDPNVNVLEFIGSVPADEPMIPTVEALAFNVERKVIVNVLNSGNWVQGVPTDYECECWAILNKDGVHPLNMKPQPKAVIAEMYHDRIAPVEMELQAFETGRIEFLEELVMMDPWTKSHAQARKLIRNILNMPCNREMKECFGMQENYGL